MALQFHQLKNRLDQGLENCNAFIWQQSGERSWWIRFLVRSCQIAIAVMRDLLQGQLSLRAMSLVFTTVIGFFPLLGLSFAVLKSLGVHNAMEPTLLTLLQPLGERSNELTSQMLSYVDNLQVELIGVTSIAILLYIVLDMMRKIESSFNYIWEVTRGRSWSSRLSEYLFAVIVSPLLLFMSISISSYVNTNFFERFLENLTYGGLVLESIAFGAPILLMSLAFAFAYGFLPNTKVQFSSAFVGGLVTTIIWKLMGSVFQGIFVAAARESIYLAFATAIPVMFFIYIGWLVALIGSSIAFYHQNPAKARTGREQLVLSISQQEQLVLALAAVIIRRFSSGERPASDTELADILGTTPMAIDRSLQVLFEIDLIARTADDPPRYLPSSSVSDCTLVDIWRLIRHNNACKISLAADSDDLQRVAGFQAQLDTAVERELGSLKFSSPSSPASLSIASNNEKQLLP